MQEAGRWWGALWEWALGVESSPSSLRRLRQVAVALLVVAVAGFLIDGVKRVPHPYIVPTIHPPSIQTPAGTETTTPGGTMGGATARPAGTGAAALSRASVRVAGLDAYA